MVAVTGQLGGCRNPIAAIQKPAHIVHRAAQIGNAGRTEGAFVLRVGPSMPGTLLHKWGL